MKMYNIKLKKIFKILLQSKNIIITCHKNPDTDSIGSSLALFFALKSKGKNASVISCDVMPKSIKNIIHIKEVSFISNKEAFDTNVIGENASLVVLDAGEMSRIGYIAEYASMFKNVIFIDHHKQRGDINKSLLSVTEHYIDDEASATGEIISEMLYENKIMSSDIATLLYGSIASDTGSFLYSNTNAKSLSICSKLIKDGCEVSKVLAVIKRRYGKEEIIAQKYILNAIVVLENINTAYLSTGDTIEGIPIFDLSISLIESVMQIDGVNIGFVLRKEHGVYRASIRSRCEKNILSIAEKFGGGGHLKASGFEVSIDKYSEKELIKEIIDEIKNLK